MRSVTLVIVALCSPWFGACHSAEPPYPASVLVFDEGLVGTWEQVRDPAKPSEQPIRLTVAARKVPIVNGRLHAEGLAPDGSLKEEAAGEGTMQRPAYRMTLTIADPAATQTLLGIGFQKGGRRFLGLQVPPSRLDAAGLGGWVIPVHRVIAVEREGDVLRIRVPRIEVGWIPVVDVLDGTGPPTDTVRGLIAERAGPHVTTKFDRLLELCNEAARDPTAWEDESIELRRVE